ncbi:MAG: hypothetical protein QOC78_1778 [Solirubrobacteraceae bacterium]|jgi:hypothetical protein|nr:hypothetical protein [Solirubrobacteraceae bacterium]
MPTTQSPLCPPSPPARPSVEQLRHAVEQLHGWRLCWQLGLAAGELREAEHLARTLTEWLELRARQPAVVPDMAELARSFAVDVNAGRAAHGPAGG